MVDGTFKTAPDLFYQVYTVHGVNHGVAAPFVYAYMPGKTEELYTEFFTVERNKTQGKPEVIICDFEKASINACRTVFPATDFSGCLFHLTQNVYRHVQKIPDLI